MTRLTVQTARELQPGQTLKCHVVQGLELRARATIKTWHLYYRGKDSAQRRPKLGTFPALSIEAAREAARQLLERIARGDDPSAEWRGTRSAPTIEDLWADYWERHAVQRKSPRARAEDARNYTLHIQPHLGRLRVRETSRDDIDARLSAIRRAGKPIAANRVRALLSKMFELACDPHGLAWRDHGTNPVAGSIRAVERARRRKAEPDELARIGQALASLRDTYPYQVAAIRVMMLAGTRVTEILTARRSDMQGNGLIRTEHKTERTGEVRHIVLPRQAIAEIAALPVHANGYIFGPIGQHKEPRHATRHVWEMARAIAGCPDLRQQDLRRTFASVAKSRGVSLDKIGELFSHASTQTTAGYAWLYNDAKNDAAQSVADAIGKALGD